jgi:cephalosporin hydroxylase
MPLDIEACVAATTRQNAAEGCVKTIEDLDRYRAVIDKLQPTLIVECGTLYGGSALWLADTAGCPVITLDINDRVRDEIRAKWAGRVTRVLTDSAGPTAVKVIRSVVSPSDRVLLILDSWHSREHVLDELNAHAEIADYIVVEDGVVRWMHQAEQDFYVGNPLDAIEAWFPGHPEWVEDLEVAEMSTVSMHPRGWWKRSTNA